MPGRHYRPLFATNIDPDGFINSDLGFIVGCLLGIIKSILVGAMGEHKFANRKGHINKMETFWSVAAKKFMPLVGVRKSTFLFSLPVWIPV